MNRVAMIVVIAAGAAGGCDRPGAGPAAHPPPSAEPAPTNRVEIPAVVRQNLGITFARVERRDVSRTLRVPGRFELTPSARQEHRVPAAGRVEVLVDQFESVQAGTVLYRLDSPRWRELQRELADARAALRLAEAAAESIAPFKAAHERHHEEIQTAVGLWTQRVASLERLRDAGGASGDEVAQARATLSASRAALAETLEKEADLVARERQAFAQLAAAGARLGILMETAASLTGLTPDELAEEAQGRPRWQSLSTIEVRATAAGVVDAVAATSGGLVEQHGLVVSVVRPEQVRFRAAALQSDLGRLTAGQSVTVVAPRGGSLDGAAPVRGTLGWAPVADASRRTIELVVTPEPGAPPPWARAGVSAFVEVIVAGGAEELAIPLACVVRDGLESIIFRRDPAGPDRAIRMQADLGADDGRWVVVRSGLAEGNEVVLDGVYQLMIATSGSIARGGHFHPDGTFHEGDK
ncbi:MAG: efflux RND transporter periplasmic adaptor subunit [Phycisphaerae bacterium]|nr:efflux RND transporter periplasmic adaptor subunit [Phycisphaerae bacterium]